MLNTMSSYLWDYLRKTNASGTFLPLSGGVDSGITAMIVYYLSDRLLEAIGGGSKHVLKEVRKMVGDSKFLPKTAQEICSKLLYASYLGTKHSSEDTKSRAKELTQFLGVKLHDVDIDDIVEQFEKVMENKLNFKPRFKSEGGSW